MTDKDKLIKATSLTIEDLKKEAIVELYNSAQFLEEFCAHMSCDTCVLSQACAHIVDYPKKEDSMYYLMYQVKNRIWEEFRK